MRLKRILCGIFILSLTSAFAQTLDSPAPNFSGVTMEGKTVQLSDFKGNVVLLDIWASWCGPCKQEFPFLIETYREYKDQGLAVIAVNIDKEAKNVQKFISGLEVPPDFSILLDKETKIPPLYKVEAMPTTVLIDRQGLIRYRHVGFKPDKKGTYLEEIQTLLKEKSEP